MPAAPDRPLVATYRLQVRGDLTLDRVREEWIEPLAALGVSHLYLSPVFAAAAGSTHGYDVVDPGRVDPVLGGDEAFERLAAAAHAAGLGLVVDLVPNHMATDHDDNEAWWELLANGPAAAAAGMFDLDWDTPERRLRGRLLLPVLPDHYGRELERGAFGLELTARGVELVHPSTRTPVEMSSLAGVLDGAGLPALAERARELPDWHLPHDPDQVARRRTLEPELRADLLAALGDQAARRAVKQGLATLAADVERLDDLVEAQPYRLARWQTALEDLGYRRFFDVNTLVGVRVDRPAVFDATHRLVRSWVERGLVDGLRVDHPDGLRWPASYLERLRDLAGPERWIVVEKILEPGEPLPPWPVDGTTGYEMAEIVGRLDLDDGGRAVLDGFAAIEIGADVDVEAVVRRSEEQVIDELLAADLNRLTELLLRVCERRRRFRDVTRRELHDCLRAVLVRLPVYRTYARPHHPTSAADREVIAEVLAAAADDEPTIDPEVLELLGLLLPGDDARDELEWDVVARFQQLSGPAMAKGVEDTAWFRLASLWSRSEVGADPTVWQLDLEEFHDLMTERQRTWPLGMVAGSTHDTKRSEDARARLALVSQCAEDWVAMAQRWMDAVATDAPDPVVAYQVLQTMVAAWPIDEERLSSFMSKAVREAKVHTSWLRPDEEFERAVGDLVRRAVTDDVSLDLVGDWVRRTRDQWVTTLLAQKLRALTLPGVPDLYQGTEAVSLRLTDPDNRIEIDPAAVTARVRATDGDVTALAPAPGADDAAIDLAKTAVVRVALAARRAHPECFDEHGTYRPLWAAGPRADHALAYGRGDDVVVVTPRRVAGVADGWRDTTIDLPDGRWLHRLAGTTHEGPALLADLLATWPVALLTRT